MTYLKAADSKADTTLRGRLLAVTRMLWAAIAVLVVGLYIAALPYDLQELRRVCSGDDCRVDVQLTVPDALALEDMGLSIGFYAGEPKKPSRPPGRCAACPPPSSRWS